MTRHRSTLVSVSDMPYYHVIARCVRPTFLCGEGRLTGKSFVGDPRNVRCAKIFAPKAPNLASALRTPCI